MLNSATGVRAKLARAMEHLVALDGQVGDYLDTSPVDLQRQLQPDGVASVFALRVTRPPPITLAVLAGEVVYQLGSALDHLAYQLVLAAGNRPTRRTAFPVLRGPPKGQLVVPGGVSPAATRVIEELQPYQRRSDPNSHPLAVLNTLWNLDKHRALRLTATMLEDSRIFVVDARSGARVGGQFQACPLGDNDIIGVFCFERGHLSPDTEIEASGQLFVAFADAGPWGTERPATVILEELHRYVTMTVVAPLEALA